MHVASTAGQKASPITAALLISLMFLIEYATATVILDGRWIICKTDDPPVDRQKLAVLEFLLYTKAISKNINLKRLA